MSRYKNYQSLRLPLLLLSSLALMFTARTEAGNNDGIDRLTENFPVQITNAANARDIYIGKNRSDKSLYLMDNNGHQILLTLDTGPGFQSIAGFEVINLDADADDEIRLIGSFYQDPDNNNSSLFEREIQLDFRRGQWRQIPRVADGQTGFNAEYPGQKHRVLQVGNEKQLIMNGPLLSGEFDSGPVNFTTDRIVMAQIFLSSGSMRVRDIEVYRNGNHYFINYQLDRPEIGTMDIKIVSLYAILPKDGRQITIIHDQPPAGMTKIEGVITGVLNQSTN